MSGNKFLLDTNIVLYLLGGNKQLAAFLMRADVYISIITEIELLAFPGIKASEMTRINQFLQTITIVPLRQDIKETTIDVRRNAKLKLPDSIIAATAKALALPLITSDKGFERVDGIILLDY